MAFQTCARTAMRETFPKTRPVLLEPVMKIEIECPSQFQGTVVGNLTCRRGMVVATEFDGVTARIEGEVPLAETFGYSTDLRSMTQGQGTFTHGVCPLSPPAVEHRAGGHRPAEGRRHGRGPLKAEGGGRRAEGSDARPVDAGGSCSNFPLALRERGLASRSPTSNYKSR